MAAEREAIEEEKQEKLLLESGSELLELTPDKQGHVWARIAYHLARYFMAIQQRGSAIQLYMRIEELTTDPTLLELTSVAIEKARGTSTYYRNMQPTFRKTPNSNS